MSSLSAARAYPDHRNMVLQDIYGPPPSEEKISFSVKKQDPLPNTFRTPDGMRETVTCY
jgi:hypothetical protein